MIRFTSLLLLSLLASISLGATEVRPLKEGDRLPDAVVRTEKGDQVTLRAATAGKPTVLVFYRGGWCPYCTKHLAVLAEIEGDLRAAGFQIVALSMDRPEKLRARPTHQKLSYTLLSDSRAAAAQACGIAFRLEDGLFATYRDKYGIDLEADSGETHHLLPHPAVFIADAAGIVRFAHVNPDYRVRLNGEEILAAARAVLAK